MNAPFSHEIRVRYAECDAQGCVFNAQYLVYFDVVMTELWRAVAGGYGAMVAAGTDMVVAEAAVRYHVPVRFDDVAQIEALVEVIGTTSLTTAFRVLVEGELMAEGRLRHVFVATADYAKRPIPEEIGASLSPFLVESGASAR